MGCSTLDVDGADVGVSDRGRRDPGDEDPATVRAIRDEVERRVVALFDAGTR